MAAVLKYCEKNFRWILAGYLLLQLLLLLKLPMPYSSDSRYLYELTQQCLAAGAFYPLPAHLYHDYLVAPVFVNLLVKLLHIWNSQFTIGLFNAALNMLQVFLLFKIGEKLFFKRAGIIGCLLYMLYLNNAGMVLMNFNDLFFNVLVSAALLLYMRGTFTGAVAAGICTGLAIGVRPIAWAFAAAAVMAALWQWKKSGESPIPVTGLIAGAGAAVLIVGLLIKASTGTFVFTSNFSGLNIIIGASDDARGGFQSKVFEPGHSGYIENIHNLTHEQREEFWRQQAYAWIAAHPFRWTLLAPLKLIRMYITDDYAVSRLFFEKYSIYHVYRGIKYGETMPSEDSRHSAAYFGLWIAVQIAHHLFFFWILWISLRGLRMHIREKRLGKYLPVFLLYCAGGLAMTLLAYGEARYKYPYMPAHFMFAAVFIAKKYPVVEKEEPTATIG